MLRLCLRWLLLLPLLHCWRWGRGWEAPVGRRGWQPLPVEGGGMERQGVSGRYGRVARSGLGGEGSMGMVVAW